jgi:hypothetical protein
MKNLRIARVSPANWLVRSLVCALVLLAASLQLGAVTNVTLNSSASPSAADAGVTNVTVVGHGFPSGTIPPANVTVTLNPTTSGAGPSGTTTATAVTFVSGATYDVTFVVPTSIAVSTATSYQVGIAGTTSTGAAFASINTASLTVNAPVKITTASPLPAGKVGVSYSETLTATGGSGQYTWALTKGSLPAGLTLNTATGVISGQPTTAATSSFLIKVTDSLHLSNSAQFSLTINPAIVITTTSPLPTGTVGVNYSTTLAAKGGGPYTWAVTQGSLPAGLTLASSTGVISGQPTTSGTSNFTIQVTGSGQASTTKAFALTINPALVITTSSPLPAGTVGVSYAQTVTATGGSGQYSWAVSVGSLPGGLTLNAATGVISGQPTTANTSNFTIQVTDSNLVATAKAFALTINPPLLITTTSPLPVATGGAAYSQTFAASGGAGGYSWSATGLPAWLGMTTAGVLSGTPPTSAVDVTFTVKVTDSASNSTSGSFTVPVTLAITTTSPLPTGQVGVSYSQTLTAVGGTGTYTWTVTVGSLPAGLTLASATGLISGQPTTSTAANFTIQVQDSAQVTATLPVSLTINPAATILSVSPNTSNAGLSLQVTITGSYTHFVQGTTVASFGPGVAVGGGTAGQAGPVTVTSPTSATAELAIGASAATGSQTVTVTTGTEQPSLANGFTIQAAIPYISLTTTSTTPLAQGFSGFHDDYLLHGVEYWDPKWLAMVEPLKPGWIRYPAGTLSMAFDWQAAHVSNSWITELTPNMPPSIAPGLPIGQEITQAKGGSCFIGGSCVSDFATYIKTLGANAIVDFNGWTDTNPNSAGLMVSAAQTAGLNIIEWEIDNEPYVFPKIFATPAAYAASAYSPYYQNIKAANPNATAGLFFQGQFLTLFGNYQTWDAGMSAYTPQYWQGVSFHVYPIDNETMATSDEEQTLNGILAHGTTEYYSSYVQPLVGQNTPIYFTEVNTDGYATMAFESYIYNAIFLAEWTARMSTIPQVKAVGISMLFLPNYYNQGMIRAVSDYESYLETQVKNNPNYSTDTSTNPHTQYSFYYSTDALAMEITNLAINSSNATWPTTVTGGPTVPIEGYDGNPVPAIFAQGFQGTDGTHYLLITNKSSSSVPVAIEVDGNVLQSNVTVSYISSATDTAQNTATAQTAVQIVTTTSANPITVGPYSVTRVQW